MILWLWRLIWGTPAAPPCEHKWDVYQTVSIYDRLFAMLPKDTQTPIGQVTTLRCQKCGDLKNHKVQA